MLPKLFWQVKKLEALILDDIINQKRTIVLIIQYCSNSENIMVSFVGGVRESEPFIVDGVKNRAQPLRIQAGSNIDCLYVQSDGKQNYQILSAEINYESFESQALVHKILYQQTAQIIAWQVNVVLYERADWQFKVFILDETQDYKILGQNYSS